MTLASRSTIAAGIEPANSSSIAVDDSAEGAASASGKDDDNNADGNDSGDAAADGDVDADAGVGDDGVGDGSGGFITEVPDDGASPLRTPPAPAALRELEVKIVVQAPVDHGGSPTVDVRGNIMGAAAVAAAVADVVVVVVVVGFALRHRSNAKVTLRFAASTSWCALYFYCYAWA